MGVTNLILQLPSHCLDPVEIDQFWMQQALTLAQIAQAQGEVPVGALVVLDGLCVGYGYNSVITLNDPTAHAEVLALRMAGLQLNNYRLLQAVLYVTLEPCPMCAGAMVHARVGRVVYAALDPRTGASGEEHSVFNLLQSSVLNHRCQVSSGVLAEASTQLLRSFFQAKRDKLSHTTVP
jgi:tRNA(adenine34) deaminase